MNTSWKASRNIVAAAFAAALALAANAGEVAPQLKSMLKAKPDTQDVAVIVTLSDKVDPAAYSVRDRRSRSGNLVKALKAKAANTQGLLHAFVKGGGGKALSELWLINGIAVTVPASLVEKIARFPGVESVRADALAAAPAVNTGASVPREWNLDLVLAPDLWALGLNGAGIVVANMDTGVDPDHPDLAGKWRGGANSWFDPHAQHATPYDASGHGTQTMALIVGGDAGGTAIGVAPGARWIAAKLYNDAGVASYSHIHLAFQWLLDPDGNPDTQDAPDVVNASWGLVGTSGQCITEFDADIQLLKAAGIAVAFGAGNDGPAGSTSLSPANNASAFSVGAVDVALGAAGFSARGPSACTGAMYPNLAAPGVNVNTADLSFGGLPFYINVSGTSYAAPHVAGTMALLMSAFPAVSVQDLEAALAASATDLGTPGDDNSYGFGLLNAKAAHQLLAGGAAPPTITSTPVTTATPGVAYTYTVTASDPAGGALTFTLDVAPAGMSVGAASGTITWTPAPAQAGANAVTVRVTNPAGLSSLQSFTINVASLNQPPVAANDSHTILQGTSLAIGAPGVLGNDSDPDGNPITAVLVAGPAHGTLTLSANGSFIYTPVANYSGADTFSYRAFDGTVHSNVASVNITITPDRAPSAANDSYSVIQGTTLTVAAPGVLANDTDPDGTAITAVLRTGPTRGTLTLVGNGSFTYRPNAGFSGTDSFTYRAYDGILYSAAATVTITVTANQAPVAVNDNATAPPRGSGTYVPVVIAVLANDTDANGNIDPATVSITTAPNKGGKATINANGTVSYVPKANFHGTETFKYRVRDSAGAQSNAATVTVVVP